MRLPCQSPCPPAAVRRAARREGYDGGQGWLLADTLTEAGIACSCAHRPAREVAAVAVAVRRVGRCEACIHIHAGSRAARPPRPALPRPAAYRDALGVLSRLLLHLVPSHGVHHQGVQPRHGAPPGTPGAGSLTPGGPRGGAAFDTAGCSRMMAVGGTRQHTVVPAVAQAYNLPAGYPPKQSHPYPDGVRPGCPAMPRCAPCFPRACTIMPHASPGCVPTWIAPKTRVPRQANPCVKLRAATRLRAARRRPHRLHRPIAAPPVAAAPCAALAAAPQGALPAVAACVRREGRNGLR